MTQSKTLRVWQRLKYLYRIRPKVMIRRLMEKIISPIYRREVGYITSTDLSSVTVRKHDDDRGTECTVLRTPGSLYNGHIIPSSIPVNELKRHMADDPLSIVVIATRPNHDGPGRKIIGYFQCQPGIFDAPGIKGSISPDIMFVNHVEVMPEYQGQKIANKMGDALDEYCSQNGYTKKVSVILAHNQPSIKSFSRKERHKIVGKFEFLSLFSGLYTKATTIDEIRVMIEKV